MSLRTPAHVSATPPVSLAFIASLIFSTAAFAGTLSADTLVAQALASNPSVEMARQAVNSAETRPGQLSAFADPVFSYELAPGSIGSPHGQGRVFRLSQRIEWPGKVASRKSRAMAGASAAQADLKTVQLQLAKRARLLFLEHFWLSAALAINEEEAGLLRASQASRDIAYESGRGSQSDALEAKLALSLVSSTRLGLLGAQGAVVAKINALLHRDLGAKLSQAPTQLGAVLSSEVKESAWVARAIRSRPELQRLHHQANGLRYAVMEQRRSAMPDLGFSLSYSTMWASPEHRLMAGASVSIPLHFGLRRAAVAQAKADLATSVADRQAEVDTVGAETSAAFAALVAASEQAALFSLEILPTAMAVQNTVEAEYRSGRASFSALMSASRQLWRLKLDHATAVTESHRQYALLLDAVGVLPNDQNMGGAS